ncbi:hypothetical protein [Luteococcus peritonei]|uniref:Uncharacterized protein n=1 Tax=Luteococcus peritonei TaxID=88874 RepID=A0ABW4RY84_9ACTN
MMNLLGILAALAVTLLLWLVAPLLMAPLILAVAALSGIRLPRRHRGGGTAPHLSRRTDVHLVEAEHPHRVLVRAA